MKRIFLAIIIFINISSPTRAETIDKVIGLACLKKSHQEAMMQAAFAGDNERYKMLTAVAVVNKYCIPYKSGSKVFIYEKNIWNNLAKIRFSGDHNIYWIFYGPKTFH